MDILVIQIWRIILLVVILAAAYGAGGLLLKISSFAELDLKKFINVILSITLGLFTLSYLTLLFGLLELLHPITLWGMLVLFGITGVYIARF